MDYLRHPEERLDKNYSPIRQKYRKELRRQDEETKKGWGCWLELYFEWFHVIANEDSNLRLSAPKALKRGGEAKSFKP